MSNTKRSFSENTKHLYNICTTSAQRLRRWSNIVQMFCVHWVCNEERQATSTRFIFNITSYFSEIMPRR